MVLRKVRCVVKGHVMGHGLVDVFGLDFKQERVLVGVEELAAVPVIHPHVVVVEVVHTWLGEVEAGHANIHWSA